MFIENTYNNSLQKHIKHYWIKYETYKNRNQHNMHQSQKMKSQSLFFYKMDSKKYTVLKKPSSIMITKKGQRHL